MHKAWRLIFLFLTIIFIYHFVRDILQVAGVHNIITETDLIYKKNHWCKPYCDSFSIILETFGIISSIIVLKRERVGVLGALILISLIFWPFAVYFA